MSRPIIVDTDVLKHFVVGAATTAYVSKRQGMTPKIATYRTRTLLREGLIEVVKFRGKVIEYRDGNAGRPAPMYIATSAGRRLAGK